MSKNIAKNNTKKTESAASEVVRTIIEYITEIVFMWMCIMLTFYMRRGYVDIGSAKSHAYKSFMLPALTALSVAAILYLIMQLKKKQQIYFTVTDGFVLAYLLSAFLAAATGGFFKESIWGYEGINMGLMAQISFVLIYFFLSRFGRYYREIVVVWCSAAVIAFVLAILNRANIDPIGYYSGLTDLQKTYFVSTLGQISWYGSYMAVIMPVFIGFYLYAKKKVHVLLGAVLMCILFGTLTSYNGDSAYTALAACMLVFLWDSMTTIKGLIRYLSVWIMFLLMGKLSGLLLAVGGNSELKPDALTNFLIGSSVTWVLLILLVVLCIGLVVMDYYLRTANDTAGDTGSPLLRKIKLAPSQKSILLVRNAVYLIIAVMATGFLLLLVGQITGSFGDSLSEKLNQISYLNWNHEWGNGRGRIWSFCGKVFAEEALLHKLFGLGPECFYYYTSTFYLEDLVLYWNGMDLVNAHNEWLNMLLCNGILGCVAYVGIFAASFVRCMRHRFGNGLSVVVPACITAYAAYNLFCYQEVLCTPFIFLMMGIGEFLVRKQVDK